VTSAAAQARKRFSNPRECLPRAGVLGSMGCYMTTRELASRRSGADEILLLWNPCDGRVEVAVRDIVTGVGFHVRVAATARALDVFHHVYAYVGGQDG
jgi:hypothetical protein